MQAFACVVLAVPVLIALAAGDYRQALVWLGISGPLATLVVVPVRGRPALRWLGDLLLFQLGVLSGWSVFQSRAATGTPGPAAEPDLPGVLTRLRFPDGPVFSDRGRICLIHDTAEGRWGATAQLTHTGTGMLSAAECDQLAARLGSLLSSIGHRDVVDRLSLYVRTVPDDATEYQMWRARHTRPGAPELAHRATTELDATIGSVSLRTELFVCVSGSEDVLRRPAAGRRRRCQRPRPGALPRAGRHRGRPQAARRAAGDLADQRGDGQRTAHRVQPGHRRGARRRTARQPRRGKPAAAGGGRPDPRAHPRRAGLPPRRIHQRVLRGADAGERADLRRVGAPAGGAHRRGTAHAGHPLRGHVGRARRPRRCSSSGSAPGSCATSSPAAVSPPPPPISDPPLGARDQEYAVAAGAALVRFAVATSVTVPSSWPVEDHAARLENDAAGRARLLRLELAQDSAFVAAVLPVGIGLPRQRGALP